MLFSNFERRKRNLKSFSPVSRGEREILNSFPLFWEEKEKTRVHTIIEIINRNLPLNLCSFSRREEGQTLVLLNFQVGVKKCKLVCFWCETHEFCVFLVSKSLELVCFWCQLKMVLVSKKWQISGESVG